MLIRRFHFRRVLLTLVVALLAVVPGALLAGEVQAAPKAAVGGGTAIIVGGNGACTMTAVGRDRTGRLVGLTAAHCGRPGATVRAERQRGAGVLGHIARINTKYDTAVVALDPARVRPVRTVGQTTITRVGSLPGPGAIVCKQGRSTGRTCGPLLAEYRYQSTSYVCGTNGDSGAPVVSGSRLVAMQNGRERIAGVSVSCPNPGFPVHTPMVATTMTDILGSLNRAGGLGAGFRPL